MKVLFAALCCALVVLLPLAQALSIWPKPPYQTSGTGSVVVDPKQFTFTVSGKPASNDVLKAAFTRYYKYIFDIDDYTVPSGTVTVNNLDITFSAGNPYPALQLGVDESYSLSLDGSKFAMQAATVWGALRGLETFSQLVSYGANMYVVDSLPISVKDSPRFPWRGLMIDSSRHFLSVATIKRMIDGLSFNKMNTLHWHIIDAQSFPLEVPAFSGLSRAGAYRPWAVYTKSDVADVVEYGRLRGVRVMVELDIPGHAAAWGEGYSSIVANCPSYSANINNIPLNPALDYTYEVVNGVISHVASLTIESFIHLGGDEIVTSCMKQDPTVQQFMTKQGYTSINQVIAYFEDRLEPMYRKFNKTLAVWEDIYLDNGWKPPQDALIHVWRNTQSLQTIAKAGYKTLLSAGWYLNDQNPPTGPQYSLWQDTWKNYYVNEPFAGTGWTDASRSKVMGGEAAMWGEQVDDTVIDGRVWPRTAAVGERLWSPADVSDVKEAVTRLDAQRCRMVARGINASPIVPGMCDAAYAKHFNLAKKK